MRIEVITIGDELLLGFTIDTNSAFLARELAELGIAVARRSSVADNRDEIAREVRAALERTGAVITSGGLGPTSDDVSVEAVAVALGRELIEDASVIARMEERFRAMGNKIPLNRMNRRQALVPSGAEVLINRHGTAPGLWIADAADRVVVMLPGVPRELRGIFVEEVKPRLARAFPAGGVILSRTLRTTGIAESVLAQRIADSGEGFPSLAYLPGWEGVDLRVTISGLHEQEASQFLAVSIEKLRRITGHHAYAEDATDLASVVLQEARRRGERIVVAESCTGGMLGARLTAIPGSSDVFLGGIISYSNDVKNRKLGVSLSTLETHGAVSEQTVLEMAAGVCDSFGSEIGIAISGIAGPGGGTAKKPVGTVCVAVQARGTTSSATRILTGDRDEIRRRATQMALDSARLLLSQSGEVRQ
jgi:nicotinamide-nucleotide amidase